MQMKCKWRVEMENRVATEEDAARLLDRAIGSHFLNEHDVRNCTLGEWIMMWVPLTIGVPTLNYLLATYGHSPVTVNEEQ